MAQESAIHGTVALDPGSGVDVGTSSTPVAGVSARRQSIRFVNPSDTVIWLRLAATGAVVNAGIPVFPRGGVHIEDEHNGALSAIHENKDATGAATTGATKRLCITETGG